ncbi:MAG: CcmD family protein [Parafilimonas sp.]
MAKSFAQNVANNNADQNNFMTSEGKIFVVMAVVIVIVIGLFLYLFNLDRKISKLEKNIKS